MSRHELLNTGTKTDRIPVELSYQIIHHFSAGLYTSPNKAIEELVANSYDAWARNVYIIMPENILSSEAIIWVIDDGDSMDVKGFKDLWRIGESNKRNSEDKKRLPIGKFGIGKLATYVLARELTYICRCKNKYRVITMDFAELEKDPKKKMQTLDVRELSKKETMQILQPILKREVGNGLSSKLFSSKAPKSWTVAAMSNLTNMAKKLSDGRLKHVLKTALPISPQFNLYYGNEKLSPQKVKKPVINEWIIGNRDKVAQKLGYEERKILTKNYVLIPSLGLVTGECQLFEDPLTVGKSKDWGRSHGFFVMVRNRLINLHDELFGLEALSHGTFSRFRMVVHADGLDEYLRATRETVSEDEEGVRGLRKYLKAKFNEARGRYNTWMEDIETEASISRRISGMPQSLSRQPLLRAVRKLLDGNIKELYLTKVPSGLDKTQKEALFHILEEHVEDEDFFNEVGFESLGIEKGLALFDVEERKFKINMLHPFFLNYCDHTRTFEAIQLFAIAEVLTEAYLLESNIKVEQVRNVLERRDRFLRELVYGTQLAAPAVAQLLNESKTDSTEFENAVYEGLKNLGFETNKIGGRGEPDGIGLARLGVRDASGESSDYKFTYDAKSSEKERIKANTALPPSICRHRDDDYKADYAFVIAPGFEGEKKQDSAIAKDARRQKVTIITIDNFIRLCLIASVQPIGFLKLRELFENCYAPIDTKKWVDDLAKQKVSQGPIKEILEVIYNLQKSSPDPVKFAAVRLLLAQQYPTYESIREDEVMDWTRSMRRIAGDLISISEDVVSLEQSPDRIIKEIGLQTSQLPQALLANSVYDDLLKKKMKKKIRKRR